MRETWSTTGIQGWILYDNACGVCCRWVPFWAPMLRGLGLHIAPLQAAWVVERTGLTLATLLGDLRLLHVDGRLTSGADVYRFVMRRCWWAYPLYVLSVMPGGRHMFDWCYRTFAKHRLAVSVACRLVPPAHSA